MSRDFATAGESIRRILKLAEDQRGKSRGLLKELFRGDQRGDRKPPGDFGDSSYLFIRSHAADNGQRPLPGNIPFWLSPDLRIRPITGTGSYTQTLETGRTYDIECHLRNAGDIPVPSAKVEFFLTDPTIGFDTRFAAKLGVASTWVPGVGSGKVNIPYTVPTSAAGHKCLIARAFSFSPLDLPVDDFNLSPPIDRHVAQLNLNIISPAMPFSFKIVHQPHFEGRLHFRQATVQELAATGHPALGDFRLIESERFAAQFMRGARFEHQSEGRQEFEIDNDGRTVRLRSRGEGPSLDEQKEIRSRFAEALEAIAAGGVKASQFKDVFAAFRKMNRAVAVDTLSMQIPPLELARGEATAVHLQVDTVFGDSLGGITLMVTA